MEKREKEISPLLEPEAKEKEPLVEEIKRGDLRIQKHYVGKEEIYDPTSEHFLMAEQRQEGLRPLLDIKLINKKGESYSLKDELPQGAVFVEGKREQKSRAQETVVDKKQILFPRLGVNTEMYQVPENEKLPEPGWYMHGGERIILVDPKKRQVVQIKTVDFLRTEGAFLSLFHEIKHMRVGLGGPKQKERDDLKTKARYAALTEKEKERYEEVVIGQERDAWAFALRKARQLRKKGFDVEPTLDDPKRLKKVFHLKLHTYEGPVDDILASRRKKVK